MKKNQRQNKTTLFIEKVLKQSIHDFQSSNDLTENQQRSIIQRGKYQARMSNILITLAILMGRIKSTNKRRHTLSGLASFIFGIIALAYFEYSDFN